MQYPVITTEHGEGYVEICEKTHHLITAKAFNRDYEVILVLSCYFDLAGMQGWVLNVPNLHFGCNISTVATASRHFNGSEIRRYVSDPNLEELITECLEALLPILRKEQ